MKDIARFIGGPATKKEILIGRVPTYLRVCRSPIGALRVLDGLEDQPADHDRVTVYHKMGGIVEAAHAGQPARAHSFFILPNQPEDQITRDTAAWQAWCRHQAANR